MPEEWEDLGNGIMRKPETFCEHGVVATWLYEYPSGRTQSWDANIRCKKCDAEKKIRLEKKQKEIAKGEAYDRQEENEDDEDDEDYEGSEE